MSVVIITGPPGAGKSTISKSCAQQRSNCVRIETDDIRHMVITPHKAPWDGEEGRKQLLLGIKNTCLLTHEFINAGFNVIIADFLTEYSFPYYKEPLGKYDLKVIQLITRFDILKKRDIARGQVLTDEEFIMLYDMQTKFIHYDYQIDTTFLTPKDTVNQLVKILEL